MALSKIRAGFSNVTTYSADSSSNTIPTNADKLLFVIAAGGGGGAASFAQAGGNGGNSTVVYNSVTYTATGGTGADIPDPGAADATAPAHSGGSASGGLVITGGGSTGGASGQTIAAGYSSSPIQGLHGGMVIVQVDVVSGQTTYDVTVGGGGTAGTGAYGSDNATGAVGAGGYVLVYDNG